jgi:hypothetical protein
MKTLVVALAALHATPALATGRGGSGHSDPFVSIIFSVIATVGLTLLVRFMFKRR